MKAVVITAGVIACAVILGLVIVMTQDSPEKAPVGLVEATAEAADTQTYEAMVEGSGIPVEAMGAAAGQIIFCREGMEETLLDDGRIAVWDAGTGKCRIMEAK